MRYRAGRLLQLAGLLILPQGIVLELLEKITLLQSLVVALGGVAVFLLGLSLARSSQP
jgi:hypothetical protein